MQKRQLVFKFLLFSILFEIPLKFTNVKFLLQFYNLMSLDKNKNLPSCLQVTLKLQTLFGASTTSVTMCLHSPVSLEDMETKDVAGVTGQREIHVFSVKQVRVFFNGIIRRRNLQSISWLFWGLFLLICMAYMATFSSVFKVLVMFYLPFSWVQFIACPASE